MAEEQKQPTGADLIEHLARRHKHAYRAVCHHCGQDVSRIAIVALAYTYEECSCDLAPYTHLVERVWHRACLAQVG